MLEMDGGGGEEGGGGGEGGGRGGGGDGETLSVDEDDERKKERRRKSLGRRGFKYPILSQNCASGVTAKTMRVPRHRINDVNNTLVENEDVRHRKSRSLPERGMKV